MGLASRVGRIQNSRAARGPDDSCERVPGQRCAEAVIVQRREASRGLPPLPAARGGQGAGEVREAARRGASGPGGSLPHRERIQRSFGRHDVGSIVAHTGATAASSARAIGAEAFATGRHVVFAGRPSLRTAAHEAAHVIQQRGGARPLGGVGEVGDRHERHADEVANRVVQGRSSEALLDRHARGETAGGGDVVQRLAFKGQGRLKGEITTATRTDDGMEVIAKNIRGQTLGSAANSPATNLDLGNQGELVAGYNFAGNALTRMHLLNGRLGGPGTRGNLAWGTAYFNNPEMYQAIEERAQDYVDSGGTIAKYHAAVTFDDSLDDDDPFRWWPIEWSVKWTSKRGNTRSWRATGAQIERPPSRAGDHDYDPGIELDDDDIWS